MLAIFLNKCCAIGKSYQQKVGDFHLSLGIRCMRRCSHIRIALMRSTIVLLNLSVFSITLPHS